MTGHNTFLQRRYKLLRGDITSPGHKSPVRSLPHIFSGTLGFNLIYLPLLLSSCPMSASASSSRQKTLIPSRLLQRQEQWKHKKAAQCPGQLEVRMLRNRAAGPCPSYINILHLLITLHSPWLPARSHSSQHHWHTQLSSAHTSLGLCSQQGLRTLS